MRFAQNVDYIVLALYFILMLSIGIYYSKFSKGVHNYFAAGNKVPWWISGISLYMTNFSAWTFTAAAGFIYHTSWYGVVYISSGIVTYFLGALLTAKRWRRSRVISPIEYTQTRYNIQTQQLLSWVISANFILSAGAQLSATCKFLSPLFGIDIDILIIATGLVILFYTFLGGLWGVLITDFVQFVILISMTLIISLLSLKFAGGLKGLFENVPPFTFEHVYNNVFYDLNFLISIYLIGTIGVAAGASQRFYSVVDEKSALKVGILASILSFAQPLLFAVPPLVARIIWPDLSQVDLFKGFFQPNDLVYLGVALKILPIGLIGLLMSAMLSATMSTLSSVYNFVGSIITRDIYLALFNPKADEVKQFKFGRITTFVLGLIVIAESLLYVHSEFGIFNIMVTFFTLFNIPVNIPLAFGLIFKSIPRWGASLAIIWGLIVGAIARFVAGWSIGAQVYISGISTFVILMLSDKIRTLYLKNKTFLSLISLAVSILCSLIFLLNLKTEPSIARYLIIIVASFSLGFSLIYFNKFVKETEQDKKVVEEFFKKIETPINVAQEVYGKSGKETEIFLFIGFILIVIGTLISFLPFVVHTEKDIHIFIIVASVYIIFGVLMILYGRKNKINKEFILSENPGSKTKTNKSDEISRGI
ncbi:transporter, SSS family [Candidatus Kryptobacter tengchongensis]|nr:transporter, SSS family [Candidatus Kryptobacter tengchongensis]